MVDLCKIVSENSLGGTIVAKLVKALETDEKDFIEPIDGITKDEVVVGEMTLFEKAIYSFVVKNEEEISRKLEESLGDLKAIIDIGSDLSKEFNIVKGIKRELGDVKLLNEFMLKCIESRISNIVEEKGLCTCSLSIKRGYKLTVSKECNGFLKIVVQGGFPEDVTQMSQEMHEFTDSDQPPKFH